MKIKYKFLIYSIIYLIAILLLLPSCKNNPHKIIEKNRRKQEVKIMNKSSKYNYSSESHDNSSKRKMRQIERK